jgi:ATP-dependent DNA helicase RecG
VDDSTKIDLANATEMSQTVAELFAPFKVGLVHGRMTTIEKDSIMSEFKSGRINILVSTSIIEVGIDNQNATIVVIEHPERFGLSQLHQIRGRVGRGAHQSYCFLIPGKNTSEEALIRLKVIEKLHDGMEIAIKDLEIRGPGEIFSERQSGFPGLYMTNLIRDTKIIEAARTSAAAYVASLDDEHKVQIAELAKRMLFGKEAFSQA